MIVIGVIDNDSERWRALAQRLRGAALVSVGESQAESLDFAQAIVFSDPTHAQIEFALRTGKHVLLCGNDRLLPEASTRWTDLAIHAKLRFAIVNPDRYLPSRQLIRQQLDAGKLGEPGLIRIHRWEAADRLVRDLDLALWYFGKAPNVVHAVANTACTQIHLGFPGGGMALIDHARALPAGDRYYSLSLIGSSGAAYADDHSNMQLVYHGGPPRAVRSDEGVAQWASLLQEFVDAVAHDSNRASTFPEWNDILAVRDAIARCIASAKPQAAGGTS